MATTAPATSSPAAAQSASGIVIHQYPLTVRGQLVRRYKRFLADVLMQPPPTLRDGVDGADGGADSDGDASLEAGRELSGGGGAAGTPDEAVDALGGADASGADGGAMTATGAITCHCPNTGPMVGLLDWSLAPVVCSVSQAPGRKYKHTLEMIQSSPGGAWVGVHSALANRLVGALLERRLLVPYLGEWREVQREVPYGSRGSRVDFVLTRPTGRRVFVEVKSVTLAEPYGPVATAAATTAAAPAAATEAPPRIALFPDTVSERAQRHVEDLMEAVQQGHEAACVFVIQRNDCAVFGPCVAKDPKYAKLVRQAAAAGVQMLALRMSLQPAAATAATVTAAADPHSAPAAVAVAARPPTSAAASAAVTTTSATATTRASATIERGDVDKIVGAARGRAKMRAPAATRRRARAVQDELNDGNDDDDGGGGGASGAAASIAYLGLAELDLEYGNCTDVDVAGAAATAATTRKGGGRGKRAGGPAAAGRGARKKLKSEE
ncbi:hypothetical protein PLESTB_000002600 [Pleodorina starrii]|uniref:Sugar fermentation stimulation protein C-terminal domain-containing protein n=1 Tax=Pleodorina starrii TaxID=330485 RepID=A0A9W6B9H0_9CHLO|nr:hypothetical protein PLESTM_000351100 [Pleodorina starrii]GLC47572.1 hypothetical protein PLESTB_000002600 [Pleodorina starrii]GLC76857.1 hypothetical protein PLESTF_001848600 [Pleodorina starrii]